jgi:two-component system, cell cycle sensor histidine kinase and response regulator CckA
MNYRRKTLPKLDFREYDSAVSGDNFTWGPRRILVVEDDAPVRDLLVRVLQENGYLVAAAKNGQEALDLAQQQSTLDLLITDLAMRGMNGIEVAQKLLEQRPDLKIIITSSFRPEQFGTEALPFEAEFIEKPWAPGEMLDRVATVLGRG